MFLIVSSPGRKHFPKIQNFSPSVKKLKHEWQWMVLDFCPSQLVQLDVAHFVNSATLLFAELQIVFWFSQIFPKRFRVWAFPQFVHYLYFAHSLFIFLVYIVGNSFNSEIDFKFRLLLNLRGVRHITPQQFPAAKGFWILCWITWIFSQLFLHQNFYKCSQLLADALLEVSCCCWCCCCSVQLLEEVEASRVCRIKTVHHIEKSPCGCFLVAQNCIQQWHSTVSARIVILCLALWLNLPSRLPPFNNVLCSVS